MEIIVTTNEYLSSTLEMDMGEENYVLEVKTIRGCSKNFYGLSQISDIKKILEQFRIHNSKPIDTSIKKVMHLA